MTTDSLLPSPPTPTHTLTISVMIMSTQFLPVTGREQLSRILCLPCQSEEKTIKQQQVTNWTNLRCVFHGNHHLSLTRGDKIHGSTHSLYHLTLLHTHTTHTTSHTTSHTPHHTHTTPHTHTPHHTHTHHTHTTPHTT